MESFVLYREEVFCWLKFVERNLSPFPFMLSRQWRQQSWSIAELDNPVIPRLSRHPLSFNKPLKQNV